MLLRGLVIMVFLLNLGYFAWSQHWLDAIGLAPVQVGEPERMQQQLRPEAVQIAPDHGRVPQSAATPEVPSLPESGSTEE